MYSGEEWWQRVQVFSEVLDPHFGIDPVRFAEAFNLIGVDPAEQPQRLYATRLIGHEKWKAPVLLNQHGEAVGYTGKQCGLRRVKLGYTMGCVKDEDPVLLPLGYE